MKKSMKEAKTPQRARIGVSTKQALAAVVGGHNGTIIVESLQGVGGTGLQGISGGA